MKSLRKIIGLVPVLVFLASSLPALAEKAPAQKKKQPEAAKSSAWLAELPMARAKAENRISFIFVPFPNLRLGRLLDWHERKADSD